MKRRIIILGIVFLTLSSLFLGCEAKTSVRIAFQSERDGNEEIYVMDADGSNQNLEPTKTFLLLALF